MGTRLYVGNLPFSATEQQIREIFSGDGRSVAEVKIITDRETGRSRGFAFVQMSTEDDATKAVSALNGRDFNGRPLTVNEARERPARTGGGGGGYGRGGGGGGGYGGGGGGGGGGYGDRGGGGGGRGGGRDGGWRGGRERDHDRGRRDDD